MTQQTAQGLAALGRGPDSMLVHMAPGEVAGLQALAMKHGGSLTINPETGLPEAGFLSSILPMVAGFALGPAGFGLMSSAMAGVTVGGISALTSGSLSKGLMAGLGAYGGAELGAGLSNAGTGAVSSAAGAGATAPQIAAGSVVPQAALPAATNVAAATPDILGSSASELAGAYGYPTVAAPTVPAINAGQAVQTLTQVPAPALSQSAADIGNAYAQEQAAQNAVAKALATTTPTDTLGAGLKAVTASPDAALKFAKANAMPLGALGISALSGLNNEADAPAQNQGMIRPYTYSRERNASAFQDDPNEPLSSKERRYFNDSYTALTPYRAPGPEYMAAGGPVEAMSDANAIGMNTGYPQSDVRMGAYATPYQQPISRNVVSGAQDAGVNPYTGQMQFADGGTVIGKVGGWSYNPKTGVYTRPDGQGATTVSPTGGMSAASGSSSGSSGGDLQPLNPKVNDYLTWEETTPEGRMARDARVEQVQGLFSLGPLGALTQALTGRESVPFNLNSLLGTPQAYTDYQNAVSSQTQAAQQYGNQALNDMSARQEAQMNAGSDFGSTPGQSVSAEASSAADSYGTGDSAGFGGGTDSGSDGWARGGMTHYATGGISNLGSYSDGGRLLRGPGDGVSDSIPAMIGQKQQARLADGEFVVPARIVSELGNGSTEAGARQLYAMMDRVQKARKKTVGKDKVATNSRAHKFLPA